MVNINRRQWLKGCSALGFTAASGLVHTLSAMPTLAADTSGYKALVCLFLFGGMDTWDTLIPHDSASRTDYESLRADLLNGFNNSGISRDRSALNALAPVNTGDFGGRQFALPNEMVPLATLFANEQAAIVANVGPLIEPLSQSDLSSPGKLVPSRLFSHNDQQATWSALATEGAQSGWGGLINDRTRNANANPAFSAISTQGNAIFLTGANDNPYSLSNTNVPALSARSFPGGNIGTNTAVAKQLLDEHFRGQGAVPPSLLEQDLRTLSNDAVLASDTFRDAVSSLQPLSTSFGSDRLSAQLKTVAEVISLRNTLRHEPSGVFCGCRWV